MPQSSKNQEDVGEKDLCVETNRLGLGLYPSLEKSGEEWEALADQKGWRPAKASASMSRLANSSVPPEATPRASRVMVTG